MAVKCHRYVKRWEAMSQVQYGMGESNAGTLRDGRQGHRHSKDVRQCHRYGRDVTSTV